MFEKPLIYIYLLMFPFFAQSQDIDQLILNRDYPQALAQIEKGLEENPSAVLYFKKGVVFEKMLDFNAAIKALGMACRMDTTETIYLEELAEANSSLGNYIDAIGYLKRAVRLAPENLMSERKAGANVYQPQSLSRCLQSELSNRFTN